MEVSLSTGLSLPDTEPDMAAKLHIEDRRNTDLPDTDRRNLTATPLRPSGPRQKLMNRESQARFVAVLLFLLTVAAVMLAGFNLQKEHEYARPDDGAWWVEQDGHLVADRVDPNGQAAKAGIKP